jgi:hypothetical protein
VDEKEVGMDRNQQREQGGELQAPTNKATLLSVNANTAPNTFRVSLQWHGNYDISDFDLQRFGKVLKIEHETQNTGWAIIERPFRVHPAYALPGWAINEPTHPLSPGEAVPLRPDLELGLR